MPQSSLSIGHHRDARGADKQRCQGTHGRPHVVDTAVQSDPAGHHGPVTVTAMPATGPFRKRATKSYTPRQKAYVPPHVPRPRGGSLAS